MLKDVCLKDRFLSEDIYNHLASECKSSKIVWQDSSTFWDSYLFKEKEAEVENTVLVSKESYNYNDSKTSDFLSLFQDKTLEMLGIVAKDIEYFWSRFYKYPANSAILWHPDTKHDWGITYYLNENWHYHWGGELMLDGGYWFAPFGNRVIAIKSPLVHKTCTTSKQAKDRLSIQSFIKLKNHSRFGGKSTLPTVGGGQIGGY